jgi:hypothetical protein
MPIIGFGENLPRQTQTRVRLKNVSEKLTFRLLGKPFVEGNHFFLTDGKWEVIPCPRINKGETCEYCDRLTRAIKQIPRIEEKEEYRKAVDKVKKEHPGCDPGITFNFPIINRETGQFAIFAATPGIRNKIEAEYALGTKILDVDLVAVNTGKHGKDKYAVSRLDSADTKELTVEETKIKEDFNIDEFASQFENPTDDDSGVAFEANSEEDGDVPF